MLVVAPEAEMTAPTLVPEVALVLVTAMFRPWTVTPLLLLAPLELIAARVWVAAVKPVVVEATVRAEPLFAGVATADEPVMAYLPSTPEVRVEVVQRNPVWVVD